LTAADVFLIQTARFVGGATGRMAKQSPYQILGVGEDASEREIERAYRRAAMRWHPDRNPDDESAAERFRAARRAFEILRERQALPFHHNPGEESHPPPAARDNKNAADGAASGESENGASGNYGDYERWDTARAEDDIPWLSLIIAGVGFLFFIADGGLPGFAGFTAALFIAYLVYKPAQSARGQVAEWIFKAGVRAFLVALLAWWVWQLAGDAFATLCASALLRNICE
jgi:curved DNA-binding protein CbpA